MHGAGMKKALQEVITHRGRLGILEILLSHGLDPDDTMPDDMSQPLVLAAATNPAAFCALASAGADIHKRDESLIQPCERGICEKGGDGRPLRLCCSPLIAALAALRPDPGS